MAAIKSYTDIEQSKKLAEILPIESADMVYLRCDFEDEYSILVGSYHEGYTEREDGTIVPVFDEHIPAWSLTALLKTLNFPSLTQNKEDEWEVYVFDHDNDDYIKKTASNPVDACVVMIEKLKELNLI